MCALHMCHTSIQMLNIQSEILLLKNKFIYLFLAALGLPVAARGVSPVVVSRGYSSLQCTGFPLQCLLLWSMGSRRTVFSSCGTQAQ